MLAILLIFVQIFHKFIGNKTKNENFIYFVKKISMLHIIDEKVWYNTHTMV